MTRQILPLLLAAASCGPRVRPAGPGDGPSGGITGGGGAIVRGNGPSIVLGEMCPDRAEGRPAVSVLLLGRGLSWSDDPDEIDEVVTSGQLGPFSVLGWNGKRAGIFTPSGASALGHGPLSAIGGYAGAGPCDDQATHAACDAVFHGCGLALAGLKPEGEDAPSLPTSGACVLGDHLVLDVDGDGQVETFAVADFLDVMHAPQEEVVGASDPVAKCDSQFAAGNLVVGTTKAFGGMDLLGVLDLDNDGRMEIVFQLRYGEKTTWTVYATSQVTNRLELIAELEPWGA